MTSKVVSIELIGSSTRAVRAINDVETAANKSAKGAATAFDQSTSKIGRSFTRIGSAASGFGVPFANELAVVGASFDKASTKGGNFGSTISKIGGVELLAAGAGIAFLAKSAIHAADDFEISHARLVTAVSNTGQSFGSAAGGVGVLDDRFIKLGFTTADTENALSRLTAATHSVTGAEKLMGLAADIARGRNIDLQSASDLLTKAAQGNYTALRRLGLASKDQIASFHSLSDVTTFLSAKLGGQAAAYAETFAGKMDALKASANKLEVELGSRLIPQIESLASGALGTVQGFESANRSLDGWLGKLTLAAVAVPVAFFAIDKLGAAGAALGGSFDRAVNGLTNLPTQLRRTATSVTAVSTEAEVAAVAQAKLTLAQDAQAQATVRSAAANAEYDAAMAGYVVSTDNGAAAAQRLVAAEAETTAAMNAQVAAAGRVAAAQGEVAGINTASTATSLSLAEGFGALGQAIVPIGLAYLGVKAANDALTPSLQSSSAAVDKLTVSFATLASTGRSQTLVAQYGAGFRDLARDVETASKADSGFLQHSAGIGEFFTNIVRKVTGARDGFQIATQAVNDTSKSLKNLYATDPSAAIASFTNLKANLIANGATAKQVDKVYKDLETTLHLLPGPTDAATQAQTNLTAAQGKFASDITSHAPGAQLAKDYDKVKAASTVVASAQQQVQAATNAGSAAITGGATAATSGAYAYLGLASSVKTADAAFSSVISSITTAASSPYQLKLDTSAAQASAAALHGKIDSATSGGSGQTAISKELDQAQKELTLADARRAVEQVSSGVKAAETQLAQARQSSSQAQAALTAAETNYQTVLKGVARDSLAAKTAVDQFTSAKNAAAGAQLDLGDTKRNLEQAKNDRPLLGIAVRTAATTLSNDRASGASSDQILQDQIALNDAKIAASAGDEAVRRAELALSDSHVTARGKTQDLTKAQRDLNGTLHGYPPTSQEAKDAQTQLTTAQLGAQSAAEGVTSATQGLQTAQEQGAATALAFKRAQADVQGQLTNTAGALGSTETKASNLISKLEDLRQKTLAVATDIGAAIATKGPKFIAESFEAVVGSLEAAVAAEPLLAGAFDPILQSLRNSINASLSQQNSATNPLGSYGAGAGPQGQASHAAGGPIVGNDPTGIPILAHPGEYVIRRSAVEQYGLGAMDALNAGKADLPKFAAGGPVTGGASTGGARSSAASLGVSFSANPADMSRTGAALMNGFYAGIRSVWNGAIDPFFARMQKAIDKNLVDISTWLTQPAADMMNGMWQSVQTGYLPIDNFFGTTLQTKLKSETATAATAAGAGWAKIDPAFALPVNWAITNVLNPLVVDVNSIARAVGAEKVADELPPVKTVGTFEKGGIVPATGPANVHQGEGVLTADAMSHLTPAQFNALQTGTLVANIYESVLAETKQKNASTGAARVVNATANKAAADVLGLIGSIKAAQPVASAGGRGGGGTPLSPDQLAAIESRGGDPRVPGHTIGEWAARLLAALGEPTSQTDIDILTNWAAHESGGYHAGDSGGLNNPLNTTEPWPGSWGGGQQGNIQNYRTFDDGIAAQAKNLSSSSFGYPAILKGLADQSMGETNAAIGASAFGTHNLAVGGPVGPGDARGIPIMAHPHEYVVQAKAVDKYGLHAMDALNQGRLPKFESGGAIVPRARYARGSAGGGSGAQITYKIEISLLDATDAEQIIHQAMKNITRKEGYVRGVEVALR